MLLRHEGAFGPGYGPVVDRAGPNADMLMDFGILVLGPGGSWDAGGAEERALLLMGGEAEFSWVPGPGGSASGPRTSARAARASLFDEAPTILHLPDGARAEVVAGPAGAELAVLRTANDRRFEPRLLPPAACRSEERGKGTMGETSTRVVRTSIEDSTAPFSNLVLGEVITAPGKWSSYPPHHHPQPEIYHYRFLPAGGFGLAAIGGDGVVLRHGDSALIREGEVHPHAAAPGYAMWYLWAIRHLEGARYVQPIFAPEHAWVTGPDAGIWRPPSERGDALPGGGRGPSGLGARSPDAKGRRS